MSPAYRSFPPNSPDANDAVGRHTASRNEYTVAELARVAESTVRNVRAYQDRGLLAPPERRGRTGIYGDAHVSRLKLIKRLLLRGYTLANIRDILKAIDEGHDLRWILGLGTLAAPHNAVCVLPADFTAIAQVLIDLVVRQLNRDENADPAPAADVATLIQAIWRVRPLGMVLVERELSRALKEAAGSYLCDRITPILEKLGGAPAQPTRDAQSDTPNGKK